MRATIMANEAFSYTAHLHEFEAVSGRHHLQITSQFAGAKTPDEQRVVFQASPDRAGLIALPNLIYGEVA